MRTLPIVLLLLTSCDRNAGPNKAAVEAESVATSFDGADVSNSAARLKHGERLTYVLGCRGCHGKDLKGKLWDDDPKEYGIMWASNLTRAAPTMTAAQLKALLSKGVHPRRKELWVMPSELFQHLSQTDLEAVVAYLQTVKSEGELSPDPKLGPRALKEIESGLAKPAAMLVRETRNVGPVDLGPTYKLGRYITRVTCAECHGTKLEGHQDPEGKTPDLVIAGAYSREEFEKLITQGTPTGNRRIAELMQSVAKRRFSHLTPHERDALYAYLKARAEQPQ